MDRAASLLSSVVAMRVCRPLGGRETSSRISPIRQPPGASAVRTPRFLDSRPCRKLPSAAPGFLRLRTCARAIQEPDATVISGRTFPIGTLDKDRHINGFNDSADPKDLEHDLTYALVEFKESAAKDPVHE